MQRNATQRNASQCNACLQQHSQGQLWNIRKTNKQTNEHTSTRLRKPGLPVIQLLALLFFLYTSVYNLLWRGIATDSAAGLSDKIGSFFSVRPKHIPTASFASTANNCNNKQKTTNDRNKRERGNSDEMRRE